VPVLFERTANPHHTAEAEEYGKRLRALRHTREAAAADAEAEDKEPPLIVVERACEVTLESLAEDGLGATTALRQVAKHVAASSMAWSLQRGVTHVPRSVYAADSDTTGARRGDEKKPARDRVIWGLGGRLEVGGQALCSFVAYWGRDEGGKLEFINARCSDPVLGLSVCEGSTEFKDWLGVFVPWPVKKPAKPRAPKKSQDEILLEGGEWHG
jgi:hypothetical protein